MAVIKTLDSSDIGDAFFSVRRLHEGLEAVPRILDSVREGGDAAVREWAAKFDRANPVSFEIDGEGLKAAERKLLAERPELYRALSLSRDLALDFAARQRKSFEDFETELSPGLVTGQRTIPVDRAGLYVPGGRFPLFSSVIMCAAPARAAGVGEVILCTPPAPHPENPSLPWADESIMAVASLCGITRVFAIGGAQAIAAMAYGTGSVPRVNVVVGPGNKFVAEAKKLVYGEAGIDLLAGPSEVMIIADDSAHPAWVAADLLAQAEHDPDAQAVLVTTSRTLAEKVGSELDALARDLAPGAVALQSLARNGCVIIVRDLDEAAALANRKAPEHLELALDPGPARDRLEASVRNFGSLFIGHRTAEVLGDYAAGLNHTLPTSGSALFTGGLSVRHFLKTATTLRIGETTGANLAGWKASLEAAELIARAEGLSAHALAARCRLD